MKHLWLLLIPFIAFAEDPRRPAQLGYFDPNTQYLVNEVGGYWTDHARHATFDASAAPSIIVTNGSLMASFNGSTTLLKTGFTPSTPNPVTFTIHVWYMTTNDTAATKDAFGDYDTGTASGIQCSFNPNATAHRVGAACRDDNGNIVSGFQTYSGSTNVWDGKRHLFTCTLTNQVMSFYNDAVLVIAVTNASLNQANVSLEQQAYVGARNTAGTSGQFFNGYLGKIQYIGVAKTQYQIQQYLQDNL